MRVTESTALRPVALHKHWQWTKQALLVIASLFSLADVALAGSNTWTPIGPDGGLVRDLAFHPTDPATMYAATSAGFYRSVDSGASWRLVNLTDPTYYFRPFQLIAGAGGPDHVHIASGRALTIHSEDRGATLREARGQIVGGGLNPDSDAFRIAASADGSAIYYALDHLIYRSTDRGATRELRGTVPGLEDNYVIALHVAPSNPQVIHAADFEGVFRSNDGGASWSTLFTSVDLSADLVWAMTIDPTNANRVWLATSAAVRVTDDAGATWRSVLPNIASDLDVDPRNPLVVYASMLDGRVMRTTDGGTTWAALPVPTRAQVSSTPRLAIHATDSSRLYLFGTSGIYASTDAGATWATAHAGILATSPYRFSPTPTSSGRYFFNIPDFGVASFSPADNSVELSPSLMNVIGTQAPALGTVLSLPPAVVASFDATKIAFSTNGGVTWAQAAAPPTSYINSLAAVSNGGWALLAGTGNGVYRSDDLGNHWTSFGSGLPANADVRMIAVGGNQTQLYASLLTGVAGINTIYRSLNGGQSWSATPALLEKRGISALVPHPLEPQILFVATNEGAFKTSDGGESWQQLQLFPAWASAPISAMAIDPVDPNIVYADQPGDVGNVLRSVDGGTTFQRLMPDYYEVGGAASLMVDPARSHRVLAAVPGAAIREISIEPDLQMTTAALSNSAAPNVPVDFTVTATNDGPFDATGVRVEIRLPTGTTATASGGSEVCTVSGYVITCPIGILRTDQAVVIRLRATPPGEGSFVINANVSGAQPDPLTANNAGSTSVSISSAPPPSNTGGGGGGGGGGSFNLLAAIALLSISLWRRAAHSRPL